MLMANFATNLLAAQLENIYSKSQILPDCAPEGIYGFVLCVLKHPTAPLLCSMVRVGREVLTIRATTVLSGGLVGSDGGGTDCSQRYLVCRTVHVFLYGVRRSSAGPMNIPTYLPTDAAPDNTDIRPCTSMYLDPPMLHLEDSPPVSSLQSHPPMVPTGECAHGPRLLRSAND